MTISSRTTYILPFLILAIVSFLMGFSMLGYYNKIFDSGISPFLPLLIFILFFTAIFYVLFRKLTGKVPFRVLQVLAIFLPAIIEIVYNLIMHHTFQFEYMFILEAILLLWGLKLLTNRYTATLSVSSIELVSLVGQHVSIPLSQVNKLEQKKNVLSFFKELKVLNISIKTTITFSDENLDEYEVTIFTKAFVSTDMFNKIIDHANKCGNGKIRQYTI